MNITDIFSVKRMMHAGVTLAMCFALAACQDETFTPDEPVNETSDGIVFRCTDMAEAYHGKDNIASRASSPKDEFEKQINTLHVFFFNFLLGFPL